MDARSETRPKQRHLLRSLDSSAMASWLTFHDRKYQSKQAYIYVEKQLAAGAYTQGRICQRFCRLKFRGHVINKRARHDHGKLFRGGD